MGTKPDRTFNAQTYVNIYIQVICTSCIEGFPEKTKCDATLMRHKMILAPAHLTRLLRIQAQQDSHTLSEVYT